MSKFKVGDKVRLVVEARNIANNLGDGNIYIVEGIKSDGIKLKGLFPYYHSSLFESVEILKENNMNDNENKIKVGDTVRLKSGIICCGLNHMTQYLVERVRCKSVALEGKDGAYDESIFIKVKSNLELIGEILSPLEAAEAIINKEKLQVFDTDMNKWFGFHSDLRNITLEDLKHIKLRHKPKTVIINGVEVVAPIDTKSLGYPDKVYGVNLSRKSVYDTTGHTNKGLFWATEEDAQKALDAMLIPFNNLNKGDK